MRNWVQRIAAQHRRSRWSLYGILLPVLALTLPGWLDSSLRLVWIVLGFSLIIFLHELGHFLVARWCSVKCLAFSIGIGPRMCGWRKGVGLTWGKGPYDPDTRKLNPDGAVTESDLPMTAQAPPHPKDIGDTDYRASWLPLGGYVRMLGQDDMDPTKISNDPHAFNRRPIWQRMCIVSAGVIMNVIFAAIVFSIIFHPGVGINFPRAIVGDVTIGSPADKAGLHMGDRIIEVDGWRPTSGFMEFTDVQVKAALARANKSINIKYERPGLNGVQSVDVTPEQPPEGGLLRIGIAQMQSLKVVPLQSMLDDEAAKRGKPESEGGENDKAAEATIRKLKPRDTIVAVDGRELTEYPQLYAYLQQHRASPVTLTVKHEDGTNEDLILTPKLEQRPATTLTDWPLLNGMGPRLRAVKVIAGGPAAKAGIKDGDIFLHVGDRGDPTIAQFQKIVKENAGNPLKMIVSRGGQSLSFNVTPAARDGKGKVDILLGEALNDSVVSIHERTPAADAVLDGRTMRIAAVDGHPVDSWLQVYDQLKVRQADDEVRLTFAPVADNAEAATAQAVSSSMPLATMSLKIDKNLANILGEQMHYQLDIPVEYLTEKQVAGSAWEAIVMGAEHTQKFILQVYSTLRGLASGTVSADNLHGIVGITKVGYDVQERGHVWLWYVLALVSVNLAVANFLPLPIVDGGLFLLLIVEKIRGKPLSLKVQSAIQVVGIVLLAGLFLFVTKNDIGMFFTK